MPPQWCEPQSVVKLPGNQNTHRIIQHFHLPVWQVLREVGGYGRHRVYNLPLVRSALELM